MRYYSRRLSGLLFALGLLTLAGCGGGAERRTGVVTGQIRFLGRNLTCGNVMFLGPNNQMGTATIDANGNYAMYDAPLGEVQIAIFVPKVNALPGAPPAGMMPQGMPGMPQGVPAAPGVPQQGFPQGVPGAAPQGFQGGVPQKGAQGFAPQGAPGFAQQQGVPGVQQGFPQQGFPQKGAPQQGFPQQGFQQQGFQQQGVPVAPQGIPQQPAVSLPKAPAGVAVPEGSSAPAIIDPSRIVQIPDRYGDPKTSGLTFRVEFGEQTHDITLSP